eukprot:UN06699
MLITIFLLIGRFGQGFWTGGQMAVESYFLRKFVPKTKSQIVRTLWAVSSCVGIVFGPLLTLCLSGTSFTIFGCWFNSFSITCGMVFILGIPVLITSCVCLKDENYDPVEWQHAISESCSVDSFHPFGLDSYDERPMANLCGVFLCHLCFVTHFIGFAALEL